MKLRAFSLLIFSFVTTICFSQYRLSGIILSASDSSSVEACDVFLNNYDQSTLSDKSGRFLFQDLSNGEYTLHFTNPSFRYHTVPVKISDADQFVKVYLPSNEELLQEVEVTDTKNDFGFTRMRAVENVGIYEGKKSEVIIPEQLLANTATNNARQVYARVAGLNIWENDGAGLQLSIGGRGLDPNRTSNFNVRQNGYDISADALGYPESYYTPPVEAIGRIQIVRGAASLQYGTQFGGLINFMMKKPSTKSVEIVARQTLGSFGFYNAFTSVNGTKNKLSYYTFFQYKRGDGWRANSHFDNYTAYANVNYQLTENTKVGIDITHMNYLAQQPGGLSDKKFRENPRQTNRERNWFKVNWNLFALHFDHTFKDKSEFNLRAFGLSAYRYSVGFRPNRVDSDDDNSMRDLIKGNFENWGTEARYLKRYKIVDADAVVLIGGRYYHGYNHSTQGAGSAGKDADFTFQDPEQLTTYDYRFPNRNASAFIENILYVNDKLSVTPGVRFEYIRTTADGYYGEVIRDLAQNIIAIKKEDEVRIRGRNFLLAGVGISYKPTSFIDVYSNISQNYRSITFSDMRISNPSAVIDQNLQDEKGYSFDIGVRSDQTSLFNYDVSLFYLDYNNRIGEVLDSGQNNRIVRKRGNIGQAIIRGIESYGELDVLGMISPEKNIWNGVVFANVAYITSEYKRSEVTDVKGKKVEFIPDVNLKTGVRIGYKNIKASFQLTYLSDQYTDATNSEDEEASAVTGIIPSYSILDFNMSYQYKKFKLEGNINNLANTMYFTRRATGYPGPGILPSDGRSFYITLQLKM